jgi:hypothetical protein
MIFAAMHWFMEFQDSGDEFGRCRNPEARGPMLLHLREEIDKSLAGDIVAQ